MSEGGEQSSWKQILLAHVSALGRQGYDDPRGVGIEFEDGCDAFWVLPGEVMSTLPVSADGLQSVDEVLAAYDEISRIRERALHVIRHHLAHLDVQVDRHAHGEWSLQLPGGASTSISVGANLTRVARDTGDVHQVVLAAFKHSVVRKPPSLMRTQRFLNTPGPPAKERPISDERPTMELFPPTIQSVLGWMGLCKALEHPESLLSPEGIQKAAEPGRISQTLMRVSEKLPGVEASGDLLKPGTMHLQFSDGGDSFEINLKEKAFARRISSEGPEAVGDSLAAEYQKLDAARLSVLKAIDQAAVARGWRKQHYGLPFIGMDYVTHLGITHREVTFNPAAPLTELLRDHSPEAAVRQLFRNVPEFAEACVVALHNPSPQPIEISEAKLLPKDVPPAPPLRALTRELAGLMDRFAERTLRTYLADERTIWEYGNRDVYDPATDTWASMADWVKVAERYLDGEYPHPMAVLILLDAGDPRGDSLARQYLKVADPHHEVSDAEVEIVWRYRKEFPEVARSWFADYESGDGVAYSQVREKLGDPVSRRFERLKRSADDEPRADVKDQEKLHAELLVWARLGHRFSPPDKDQLQIAQRMGWRDVADALEGNPYLLPGLLTIARRDDAFDEPGILLASDFILVWSRLSPSPFLARLLATAHTTDLVGLAEQASRNAAAGKPQVAANLQSSFDIYLAWHKALQPALAIAWTRCRRAGVGTD